MKIKLITIFVITLFCFACAASGQSNGQYLNNSTEMSHPLELDPSIRCAVAVAELAESAGTKTSAEGNLLRVGKDSLRLHARLENNAQARGKFLIGLVVDVEINGVSQPLQGGVVGIGDSREDAIETAVSEWAQLAGVALLGALGVKEYENKALMTQGFSVYPGATGVRGSQDLSWSKEKDNQLLERLGEVVKGLAPSSSKFHSVLIMIVVTNGAAIEGECRVDGEVSESALKAAKSLNWSPTQTSYMFKQYYVLRKKQQP